MKSRSLTSVQGKSARYTPRIVLTFYHSEVYLGSFSLDNKYVSSPGVFRINSSTVIVTWLVKILSDDLPAITTVDLSYEVIIDIQVIADSLGIIRNRCWIQQLLASRTPKNNWLFRNACDGRKSLPSRRWTD
jgi:hypothetical protein